MEYVGHSPKKCTFLIGLLANDNKVINKILFGFQKLKLSNNRITVPETNFLCAAFGNLTDKENLRLNEPYKVCSIF